jgi:hypothetical protein
MQLSEHSSLADLTASETAARDGIDNTPPPEIVANLRVLAHGLERVLAALDGKTIGINSGYRSPALNAAVGGSPTSAHLRGLAADIVCPEFGDALDVCRAIHAAGIEVDQLIHEFGRWCHVAFAPPGVGARRQLLTIASAEGGYRSGLHPVA